MTLLACMLIAGCTLPSRTGEDYAADAAATAEAAISDAGTALLAARGVGDDAFFPATVAVLLQGAEAGVEAARASFASIQPPDRSSDELRDELLSLIDPTAQLLSEMRIAARREDPGTIISLADQLRRRVAALDAFAQRHGSA